MKKLLLRLSIALPLLALAGCVYFRLYEFKQQLANFEANFTVDTSDGLAITHRHPVIRGDDLIRLGLFPAKTSPSESGTTWTIVFDKQYPEGTSPSGDYDIVATAALDADEKLAQLHLADRYFTFLTKESFVDMLKGFGDAEINVVKRLATSELREGHDQRPPEKRELLGLLGPPYQILESNTLQYRYLQRPPAAQDSRDEADAPEASEYTIHFTFDERDRLAEIQGTFPLVGRMVVRYRTRE